MHGPLWNSATPVVLTSLDTANVLYIMLLQRFYEDYFIVLWWAVIILQFINKKLYLNGGCRVIKFLL